jgi:hypothetical protein
MGNYSNNKPSFLRMNYEADIAYLEHIDIVILSSVNLWCRMYFYETEEYQKEYRRMVGIDFKNGKVSTKCAFDFSYSSRDLS